MFPQPEVTGRDKMQFIPQPRRLISKHNSCDRQWVFPRRDERGKKDQEKRKAYEEKQAIRGVPRRMTARQVQRAWATKEAKGCV